MHLRTVLTAAALVLAGTALRAEELQVTYNGNACSNSGCTATSPLTITYDVDTLSGQQSSRIDSSQNRITGFDAFNVSMTNFDAVIDGHSVASVGSAKGYFFWDLEGIGETNDVYDFGAGVGSAFALTEGSASLAHTVTGDQLQESRDPLAFMLLNSFGIGGFGGIPPGADSPGGPPGWRVAGTFTITPVPAPGILMLLLTGLAGLALSRSARQSGPPLARTRSSRLPSSLYDQRPSARHRQVGSDSRGFVAERRRGP